MQRGQALLLDGLHRNKAHRGPARRFADRLRVDAVALAALHVSLGVGWRDEPHVVSELCDRARPVMGRAAGLHRHEAGAQLGEEAQNLAPLELLAQNATPRLIGAVNLKNQLGQVQTDYANLAHGWLPRPCCL